MTINMSTNDKHLRLNRSRSHSLERNKSTIKMSPVASHSHRILHSFDQLMEHTEKLNKSPINNLMYALSRFGYSFFSGWINLSLNKKLKGRIDYAL